MAIPIKLLHEAEGHTITCETVDGELYRGKLFEAEDSMNLQMKNVMMTHRDGKMTPMEAVYIRGSKVKFVVLPDMLQNAPMFKKSTPSSSAMAAAAQQHSSTGRFNKSAAGAPRGSSRAVL